NFGWFCCWYYKGYKITMFPQLDEFGRPIRQVIPPTAIPLPSNINRVLQPPAVATGATGNQPDFSPINIQTAQPTTSEQRIQSLQPLNPDDPQYKNSRLRTVLN